MGKLNIDLLTHIVNWDGEIGKLLLRVYNTAFHYK